MPCAAPESFYILYLAAFRETVRKASYCISLLLILLYYDTKVTTATQRDCGQLQRVWVSKKSHCNTHASSSYYLDAYDHEDKHRHWLGDTTMTSYFSSLYLNIVLLQCACYAVLHKHCGLTSCFSFWPCSLRHTAKTLMKMYTRYIETNRNKKFA